MFKDNLRELRFMNKMTQEELAKRLGFSRSTINEWENGRSEPNLTTLKNIKEILNVPYDELLD